MSAAVPHSRHSQGPGTMALPNSAVEQMLAKMETAMSAVAAAGTGAVRHRGTVARVQAELAAVLEHVRC
eukprot:COSAG01_NODE_51006_length_358_cov_1.081081_1_plen_68_part_10